MTQYKELRDLVEKYTNLQGNVGYEDDVIDEILNDVEEKGFDYKVDSIGNITIHLTPENKGNQKVVIFGHSDEVGMMVKRIDDNGFLYCEKLGSVNPNCLSGLKVQIKGDKGIVDGVIGVKSHHLQHAGQNVAPSVQGIFIDVGANNRQSVLNSGIGLGSPVSFKPQFLDLLDDCVSNKSMDDRSLLAMMMYVIKRIDVSKVETDLYFVISVQEEFNTRGIMPTIREIQPNLVIGLDVTPATDTPDLKGYSEITVGKGPALTYMNHHSRGTLAGLVPNPRLLKFITAIAQNLNINIQEEIATGILTETAYISIEKTDLVVANMSLPTRYTHTPVEVISLKDLHEMSLVIEHIAYDLSNDNKFGKNYDIKRRREGRD